MKLRIRDRLLMAQLILMDRTSRAGRRLRETARGAARDERGQTPTEYLMIVGLMAAVIVIVFVTFYWNQVKDAAQTWVGKVVDAIAGSETPDTKVSP